MKSITLIIVCLCFTFLTQAQVSKTINVTAGGLYSALTVTEKTTITNLTVIGTIDASDFKTMRDNMPLLAVLDLSGTTIAAYTGQLGTYSENNIDVSFPSNTIPQASFHKLISFTFPSNITAIGEGAFSGCKFTSIEIPSTVTSIGGAAFSGCTGLTSIEIPPTVTYIREMVFMGCTGLTSYIIPSTVDSIGIQAFSGCTGLTSITIPSTVTYIGSQAFFNCWSLSSIYIHSTTPLVLGSTPSAKSSAIFYSVNKTTCILYVPVGSLNAYRTAIQWKDFNYVVEFKTTDIEQIKTDELSFYPNPVTDGFRVNGIKGNSKIILSDINGKLLFTKQINDNEYVSLKSVPQGIYLVKVTTDGKTIEGKVIKK